MYNFYTDLPDLGLFALQQRFRAKELEELYIRYEQRSLIGKTRTQVSISSMFYVQIFRTNVISSAFSSCMFVVKAAEITFVRKIYT